MDVPSSHSDEADCFWLRTDPKLLAVGKRTGYPENHEFTSWEYTHHNDGTHSSNSRRQSGTTLPRRTQIVQKAAFEKGLSTTRFHKGFQRRMYSQIQQDVTRLEQEQTKRDTSKVHLERRRKRLGALDKKNGFNVITGTFNPANWRCTTPFHKEPGIVRENGKLSEEALRAEYILLRDSLYKFYAPAWSGEKHDRRQDLIRRDGLIKPKKSTLLGIGRSDLASIGTEDMFAKSMYDPARSCMVEGVFEASEPGRYTPQKAWRNSNQTPPTSYHIIPLGHGNGALKSSGQGEWLAPPKRFNSSMSAPTLGYGGPIKSRDSSSSCGLVHRTVNTSMRTGRAATDPSCSTTATANEEPIQETGVHDMFKDGSRSQTGSRMGRVENIVPLAKCVSQGHFGCCGWGLETGIGEGRSPASTKDLRQEEVMSPAQKRQMDQVQDDIAIIRSLSG